MRVSGVPGVQGWGVSTRGAGGDEGPWGAGPRGADRDPEGVVSGHCHDLQ